VVWFNDDDWAKYRESRRIHWRSGPRQHSLKRRMVCGGRGSGWSRWKTVPLRRRATECAGWRNLALILPLRILQRVPFVGPAAIRASATGPLGAPLPERFLDHRWARRGGGSRVVRFRPQREINFSKLFD
jgi:hypothetical protein